MLTFKMGVRTLAPLAFRLFICPDCSGKNPLTVNSGNWEGERLEDGVQPARAAANLAGQKQCAALRAGRKDYAGGFGFQWQRWRLTRSTA